VPRGHRPGKTHVRSRRRSGSGGGSGSDTSGSLQRAGGATNQTPGADGRLKPDQPGFVPSPDAVVPLPDAGRQPRPGVQQDSDADAAETAAAAAAESQQWADRFGSLDAGGEARDVIRDPVTAVRRWQEALFGADLED
jgi:hypothetical protein